MIYIVPQYYSLVFIKEDEIGMNIRKLRVEEGGKQDFGGDIRGKDAAWNI